jgi:hypothetical protein
MHVAFRLKSAKQMANTIYFMFVVIDISAS